MCTSLVSNDIHVYKSHIFKSDRLVFARYPIIPLFVFRIGYWHCHANPQKRLNDNTNRYASERGKQNRPAYEMRIVCEFYLLNHLYIRVSPTQFEKWKILVFVMRITLCWGYFCLDSFPGTATEKYSYEYFVGSVVCGCVKLEYYKVPMAYCRLGIKV